LSPSNYSESSIGVNRQKALRLFADHVMAALRSFEIDALNDPKAEAELSKS
jgi:hypothetical protein